jgi:hypothetical protein
VLPARLATRHPEARTASRSKDRRWHQHPPPKTRCSLTNSEGARVSRTCLQPHRFQPPAPEILRRFPLLRKRGLEYLEKSMSEEPHRIGRCTRTLSITRLAEGLYNRSPSQMRTTPLRYPRSDKDTRSMSPSHRHRHRRRSRLRWRWMSRHLLQSRQPNPRRSLLQRASLHTSLVRIDPSITVHLSQLRSEKTAQ